MHLYVSMFKCVSFKKRVSKKFRVLFPTSYFLTELLPQAGLFHVLSSIRDTQLEMSGLRLVQTDTQTDTQTDAQTDTLILAIAVSGYSAIARWSGKIAQLFLINYLEHLFVIHRKYTKSKKCFNSSNLNS